MFKYVLIIVHGNEERRSDICGFCGSGYVVSCLFGYDVPYIPYIPSGICEIPVVSFIREI